MSTGPSRKSAEIEHAAAAWVARQDRGLTGAEQDRFFQWLAEDPRHGEYLARQRETARKLKALAQWRPEHAIRPNPDLLEPPRRRRFPLAPVLLALAACVVLSVVWWRIHDLRAPAASLAAAYPAATEQRLLEDGSTIDLNRGAQVEVRFTATERRVELIKGEALFAVAKNPQRPFIVQAGGVEIRAVGTAFNVNLQPAAVEVLVTEGTVAVDKPAASAQRADAVPTAEPAKEPVAVLEAGHRALVSFAESTPRPQVVPVSREEIARLLAWQPRNLEFTDAPLSEVIAELNRENAIKLVVQDPALAALPIGATLRSDNVEGFVRLLELSFDVQADRRGDVIVLRRNTSAGARR